MTVARAARLANVRHLQMRRRLREHQRHEPKLLVTANGVVGDEKAPRLIELLDLPGHEAQRGADII
jgi:hypothetical protein